MYNSIAKRANNQENGQRAQMDIFPKNKTKHSKQVQEKSVQTTNPQGNANKILQ